MNRIALYRAWRPQTFEDVVGQQHITQTLQDSLKEAKVSHAYLFNGPRGTGKTSTAKILAKAVNCEQGLEQAPCNQCSACERINAGAVMDVLEIDAASNRGVEEIRDIRDKVKYAPTEVKRKVYIIDEVHMLTPEAFNALLKTLEEPPEHAMFILATTEPHKLPATIISRCQRFDFRRVPLAEQIDRLKMICQEEGIEAEEEALHYLARLSDGGMRDALSLLDQVSTFAGSRITYDAAVTIMGGIPQEQFRRLAEAVLERNYGQVLDIVDEFMQDGKSADKCLENMLLYFRDLLMALMAPQSAGLQERLSDVEHAQALGERFGRDRLFAIIDVLNHYQSEMRYAQQPQMILEVAALKLCAEEKQEQESDHAAFREEIANLRSAVQQLQAEVRALKEQGTSVMAGHMAGQMTGQPTAGGTKARPLAAATKEPRTRSVRANVALHMFKDQSDTALLDSITAKWPVILQNVKERKITVHAWLIDGEPVAAANDSLLLAFKSAMHRETTEKPANKQLIEQVLSEIIGRTVTIVAVMRREWEEVASAGGEQSPNSQASEPLQMEPQSAEPDEQPWIKEAIELFGEELVKIKDD